MLDDSVTDTSPSCRKLLLTPVEQVLLGDQNVICLKDTATVAEALKVLSEHRILSAPVVTPPPEHEDTGPQWPSREACSDISAFLDIRAILLCFLEGMDVPSVSSSRLLERVRLVEERGAQYASKRVGDLDLCSAGMDGDFLHTTQARASLLELVMYGILEPKHRGMHAGEGLPHIVHRVALFDSVGHITHVISQTDVVSHLAAHKEALGPLAGMSVEQLGWHCKTVQSVTPEVCALQALRLMQQHSLSALAVVSADAGRMLGNFAVSEMRTILADHLGALALPVGEFLALSNQTEYAGYNRIMDAEVVSSAGHQFVVNRVSRVSSRRVAGEEVGQSLVLATSQHTFSQLLDLLVHHRAHRVYIVDEREVPVGVVTCTDVLRKVVEVAVGP